MNLISLGVWWGALKFFTVDFPPIAMQTIFVPHFTEPFCADIVVTG